MQIELDVAGQGSRPFSVERVLIAGYTGRDRARVLEHIAELEQLGVAPPPRVPMVYTLDPAFISTASTISVGGAETSGEAEFVLLCDSGGRLFVGVGSDHTDRKQEAVDVQQSKAGMAHPISQAVWAYEDVADHWDTLELRSWMDGDLYQQGTLQAFLRIDDLQEELRSFGVAALANTLVFGGTLPTVSGLTFGKHFRAELFDPRLDRKLVCDYQVISEPPA